MKASAEFFKRRWVFVEEILDTGRGIRTRIGVLEAKQEGALAT